LGIVGKVECPAIVGGVVDELGVVNEEVISFSE